MKKVARPHRAPRPPALASLISIAILSSCVGLGGNIKGNFACQAPDGICAPSAVIDDRALALISDDPSIPPASESSTGRSDRDKAAHQAARIAAPPPAKPAIGPVRGTPGRSSERVLRILFPSHIDAQGRLHESSAVHAVVSQGEWLTWTDRSGAPFRNAVSAAPAMPSLAEELASKEVGPTDVDPDLPDPAAVASARAGSTDPVAAIKADVSQRLKPPPRATAGNAVQSDQAAKGEGKHTPSPTVRPTMRAAAFPAAIAEDK